METTMRIDGINATVKCHNKREIHLVYCLESSMEGLADDIRNKSGIYDSLMKQRFLNGFVQDIAGMFSAMYFLHMIPEPVTDMDAWQAILYQSEH